jgi:hypothetical protein
MGEPGSDRVLPVTTTTKPLPTENARRATRKATRTIGYILSPDLNGPIECTVLDLSASGAKIQVGAAVRKAFTAALKLPDEFRIEMPRDRLEVDYKLAWQKQDMVGVSFLTAFRPLKASRQR